MRTLLPTALLSLAVLSHALADGRKAAAGKELFDGKTLSGWKLRDPNATVRSKWSVFGAVRLQEGAPGRLAGEKGRGILLNGGDGHGVDLMTEGEFGDCELHVEFNVAQGSNSGVYLQGQYEVQILDSFGKKDAELKYGDCGGIYNTAPPRTNACTAPGTWQTFDITFRAPCFDTRKRKTADARFVRVVHNGRVVHEDVTVKGPTTAALGGPEKPRGPVLLQGDHGPVAFRNLRIKETGK